MGVSAWGLLASRPVTALLRSRSLQQHRSKVKPFVELIYAKLTSKTQDFVCNRDSSFAVVRVGAERGRPDPGFGSRSMHLPAPTRTVVIYVRNLNRVWQICLKARPCQNILRSIQQSEQAEMVGAGGHGRSGQCAAVLSQYKC